MTNYFRSRKAYRLAAAIIIAAASLLAIASSWHDSFIIDEVPHVGAGYSYIARGDYRLNPEHPPLVKDLAGLALQPLHLDQSAFDTRMWQSDINGQWEFGRRLIYNSGNDAQLITRIARLPVLLFFIGTALCILFWSRRLYGMPGGLLALFLFSFSPTVIAHARFVTTDVAAAFGVITATYFFLAYLKQSTRKNFIRASAFFGIALLLKFSTFLLVPFFLILALSYGLLISGHRRAMLEKGLGTIAVLATGFILIVWPVYYLHVRNYPPGRQHADTVSLSQSFANRTLASAIIWASDKPLIRAPAHYALGLGMATQRASGNNTIYFLGDVVPSGGPIYFPLVYFIKEPLAWWLLVVVAALFLGWQLKSPSRETPRRLIEFIRNNFTEFAMILWLVIYWTVSIRSPLNIGVRHLLPIYPFAIILASGQIAKIRKKLEAKNQNRSLLVAYCLSLIALLGWYIIEDIRVFPSYLSYFNQTVGGPSGGYRFVTDSNLDWGQDLKRLADWVYANNIPQIQLDYFGWADPAYYLKGRSIGLHSNTYIDERDFLSRNPGGGWLAVSATFLQESLNGNDGERPGHYLWLKFREPVTVIGNSIFVYHIQ